MYFTTVILKTQHSSRSFIALSIMHLHFLLIISCGWINNGNPSFPELVLCYSLCPSTTWIQLIYVWTWSQLHKNSFRELIKIFYKAIPNCNYTCKCLLKWQLMSLNIIFPLLLSKEIREYNANYESVFILFFL